MNIRELRDKLAERGMKVTPQRIAILDAVCRLQNHPTAENIIDHIHTTQPSIAVGTVYNVLDALVEKGLVMRVKTESDVMRYDGNTELHHHLYCLETERIEDYYDNELDELLRNYFNDRRMKGFEIEEIKLHIKGRFHEADGDYRTTPGERS